MSKQILIVDDEERVLFVLRNTLRKLENGYQIMTAMKADEALAKVKDIPPDLIITDLIMADMGGVELTEKIRELSPDATVIWMTAYGCKRFKTEAQRLNVHRCVNKPLEIHEIRQTVREALEGSNGRM
jgi:two-component system, NtrC family, response regulator AtoC